MLDITHELEGADELAKGERLIRDHGYYPVALTPRSATNTPPMKTSSKSCSTSRCARRWRRGSSGRTRSSRR